jgi:hypothetical protein
LKKYIVKYSELLNYKKLPPMKSKIKFLALLLVLTTSCVMLPRQTEAQQNNVSFQVFYDQLSPYGQWLDYSNYGYVWIPDTGSDFVPYSTDGHWILTDYGWTWASDYAWGWATFHYGRWSFNDSLGWFWVPDNTWGPAWVNWRQSDGYYGWSPMEPGMSVSVSFGSAYDSRNDHWQFVRDRDFEREDIHRYYVDRSDRDRIVRNSIVINRTYVDNDRHATYVAGPTRESVQRATGRTIQPYAIRENNKPGQEINNGQLRIYRPQVEKNNSGRKIAPARVTDMKDVKRRPAGNPSNQNRIGQPDNRVIPKNNNVPQVQQPNRNQQDNNRRDRQPAVVTPQNNNVQPVQQQNRNQQDNNRPDRQPAVVSPQNNNVQPVQQRNVNQQDNNKRDRQPAVVTPQNNNVQPVQQRNVNQQDNNNRRDRQPAVGTPQNNNVQPVQQRNVNQQDNNNRRDRQPAVATPQNNNVQPVQPRNVNQQNNNPDQRNAPPANIDNKPQPVQNQNINQNRNAKPAKQSKSIKQQIKKEQEKIPDAVSSERK